jgi:hypothetical protein
MITLRINLLNEQLAMDRRFLASHRFRIILASIFAGSTLLYNILWMAAVRWIPVSVELGFDATYVEYQQSAVANADYCLH